MLLGVLGHVRGGVGVGSGEERPWPAVLQPALLGTLGEPALSRPAHSQLSLLHTGRRFPQEHTHLPLDNSIIIHLLLVISNGLTGL